VHHVALVAYDPAMHVNSARGLPPLWLIWLAGWLPIAFGVALAVAVASDLRSALLDHTLFLVGYMVSTVPLSLAYRSLWKRSMPWTKSVPPMLVLSLLIALAVTAGLVELKIHLARVSHSFNWRLVLVNFQVVWFVLLGFCAMLMVIGYYVSMKDEQERATAATTMARDAELRALRYQLHPHFLFNTLNAISTLVVEERTRDATRMIARLGDYLRATLHGSGAHEVTLAEEMSLAEHYLQIEKARLGERLIVDTRIGADTRNAQVPWLLLQPLIENAIRHGIAPRRGIGHLTLATQCVGNRLRIEVANDGPPVTTTTACRSEEPSGIGLDNVRARLERLYGPAHRFALNKRADGSCSVCIELPLRTDPEPALASGMDA
jgi:two-component system sensor histidine kinase AlgZ